MGKKQAANYAFMDDVESSCVVEVVEVWVGLSYAREKNEFTWQISHCLQVCAGCFKVLSWTTTNYSPLYGRTNTKLIGVFRALFLNTSNFAF